MSIAEERQLFESCVDATPEQRARILAQCADPALRARVERLLAAHEHASRIDTETGLAAAPALLAGRVGPYEVMELLGHGAMGEVYLAEQVAPVKRRVALKVIRLGMDSREIIARFEMERHTLALMTHPNIARILDAGQLAAGRPYFVMEYVAGVPVTRYCDNGELDIRARLLLFLQVCAGVQHAHRRGIIHRDLKPSNILVAEVDGRPVPKIIDFGVAKATGAIGLPEAAHTRLGHLIGTPEYMSPEQAELSPLEIDTRADVYALGALLYELLTGRVPLEFGQGAAAGEIVSILRKQDPLKPSQCYAEADAATLQRARERRSTPRHMRAQLKSDLDWIVLRALEKNRARRYGSPEELAADIERFLDCEPVSAGPPSATYRAGKFVRRHSIGVTAALTLLLASVSFAALMALQVRATERERDRVALEARTVGEISEFLIDLFKVSNPDRSRGKTVTARELLDTAADRLDSELTDQPMVQARLQLTVGEVYFNLGSFDAALDHYRRAVELFDRIGTSPIDTERLHALRGVARANIMLSDFDAGEALLTQVNDLVTANPDAVDPGIAADVWNDLGSLHFMRGELELAGEYYRRALERRIDVHGADSVPVTETLTNVAVVHSVRREYEQAEAAYLQAIDKLRRIHGEDHPQTIVAEQNLATMYSGMGSTAKARKLLSALLPRAQRVLGETHVHTLTIAGNLGSQLREAGEIAQAIELHRSVTETLEAAFGPQHRDTLVWSLHWAEDLARAGEHEAAERMMRENLRHRAAVLGASHRDTFSAATALAQLYRRLDMHDEAIDVLLEFVPEHGEPRAEEDALSMILMLADSAAARDRHTERRRWVARAREIDPALSNLSDYPHLVRLAEQNIL